MRADDEIDLTDLTNWVLEQGLRDTTIATLLQGVCERLNESGIPVLRGQVSISQLHPRLEAVSNSWLRGEGLRRVDHEIGAGELPEWRASPFVTLMEGNADTLRCRLDEGDWTTRYPVLKDFADLGGTDYMSYIIPFGDPKTAITRKDGMISSWVCDRPGGFTAAEIKALTRLQSRFGLTIKVSVRELLSRNIVNAYLGERAGTQVLDGSMHLGDGEVIEAVIWFSDLRNSSRHLEQAGLDRYLAILNRYFTCTAGPVMEQGGDVLRFIGDAVLAIFPIDRFGSERESVAAAMAAYQMSRQLQAEMNGLAAAQQEERIDYAVGLHIGNLLYGNVGVQDRLEYTVVGSAANLAARLQTFARDHEEQLIVSSVVADKSAGGLKSVGFHDLKGFSDGIELFAACPT